MLKTLNTLNIILLLITLMVTLEVKSSEVTLEEIVKPENYDPFQLYKDSVTCTALAKGSNTVYSAYNYTLYLNAVKINGLFVLQIEEKKFIELAKLNLDAEEIRVDNMGSEEKLSFFEDICESVVKKYTLFFKQESDKYGAMPIIQMYLDSVIITE